MHAEKTARASQILKAAAAEASNCVSLDQPSLTRKIQAGKAGWIF